MLLQSTSLSRNVFFVILGLAFGQVSLAQDILKPSTLSSSNPRKTPAVQVVEKVKGCVVNIHTQRLVSKETTQSTEIGTAASRVNGMGTGIVIDPRGYILTNHHVIDDVSVLKVHLTDGTALHAVVIARDPEHDLAVIKVDPKKNLEVMPIGCSGDLMIAEPVVAIGNAFGYENTVTTGVISALKRDVTLNKEVSYKSLIQTSAGINPGNSGGPLLNIHGELIGVNVAIRAGAQNIAFALPIDDVLVQVTNLLSVRRRTGQSHGLVLQNKVDCSDNPVRRWVVVDRVEAGSPAERAGIKAGDIIDQIEEIPIKSSLDLERAFLEKPLGEKLVFAAKRGSEVVKTELALRTTDRPAPVGTGITASTVSNSSSVAPVAVGDVVWKKLGIKVAPVAAETVNKVNKDLRGGMLIMEINPDGVAARAGMQKGDILIGLHQWETLNTENITFVLNHPEASTFGPIKFFLVRNNQLRHGFLP